jgi:uncharacterized membrane protein YuzA (DUF378 family)
MCCNVKGCCGKGCGCSISKIAKVLTIIGGLNWGFIGLGMVFGGIFADWNVIHMIFGRGLLLEGIVYVLIGFSALVYLFGCRCKKCQTGICDVANASMNDKTENKS